MDFDFDSLVLGPCHDAFGTSVTYTPVGRPPMSITGIFDAQYGAVEIDEDRVPFTTATPILGVRDALLPQGVTWSQDDTLVITSGKYAGQAYVVREARPDGHGETKLMLQRTDG